MGNGAQVSVQEINLTALGKRLALQSADPRLVPRLPLPRFPGGRALLKGSFLPSLRGGSRLCFPLEKGTAGADLCCSPCLLCTLLLGGRQQESSRGAWNSSPNLQHLGVTHIPMGIAPSEGLRGGDSSRAPRSVAPRAIPEHLRYWRAPDLPCQLFPLSA